MTKFERIFCIALLIYSVVVSVWLRIERDKNQQEAYTSDNYKAKYLNELNREQQFIQNSIESAKRAEIAEHAADSLKARKPIIKKIYDTKIIYALSLDDSATIKLFIANTTGPDSIQ